MSWNTCMSEDGQCRKLSILLQEFVNASIANVEGFPYGKWDTRNPIPGEARFSWVWQNFFFMIVEPRPYRDHQLVINGVSIRIRETDFHDLMWKLEEAYRRF